VGEILGFQPFDAVPNVTAFRLPFITWDTSLYGILYQTLSLIDRS